MAIKHSSEPNNLKSREECPTGVSTVVHKHLGFGDRVQGLALLLGSCVILSRWLNHSGSQLSRL